VRVEPYDVGVGDASDIAFLDYPGDIRWHRSADQRLDHNGVVLCFDHLDDFGSKIGDGLGETAPDHLKAATDWQDAAFAIGNVASLCPIGAQCEHAVHLMGVISGEELFGDRFQIFGHVASASGIVHGAVLIPW
jgi:hypothetical protein